MKEKIHQLETLLTDIVELIELRQEVEQLDLDDFDEVQNNRTDKMEVRKAHMNDFRETIVFYKNDTEFYDKDLPKLEKLLSHTLRQVKGYSNTSSHSNRSRITRSLQC